MHWKIACSRSPLRCAIKNFDDGFLMTDAEGNVTFYTYKDFPRNGREATDEEIRLKDGWAPVMKPLLSVK